MDIEIEKRPLWSDENSEEYALSPQSSDYLRGVALNLYQDIKCLKEDLAEAIEKLAAMEAEIYSLKGHAAGVWHTVPADKPSVAVPVINRIVDFYKSDEKSVTLVFDVRSSASSFEVSLLNAGTASPSHSQQSAKAETFSREELARQFKVVAAESGMDNRWHPGTKKEFFSDVTQAAFDQYVADRCPSHEGEQSAHPLTGDVKHMDGQI